MARLLADENFPRPVTVELRNRGHDVIDLEHLELTDRRLPDAAVLDMATRDGRAVLTLDRRDFTRLHRERADHSGIVACTLDLVFVALAARIDGMLTAIGRLDGQLLSIVRPGPTRQ
jgi:predicted nuclease of predicted toxin-antitoxin system